MMVDEQENRVRRALGAVQDFLRPDLAQARQATEAARLVAASENRERLETARDEAIQALAQLAALPQEDREAEMKAQGLDPGETTSWSAGNWSDPSKLAARVEADVEGFARAKGLDLRDGDARLRAYTDVGEAYGEVHLAINSRSWETDRATRGPTLACLGNWKWADGINEEYRELVVATDRGYHPGYETSHLGGEGPLFHSELAFPTLAAAESVAFRFYEQGGDEARFLNALSETSQLPEGHGGKVDDPVRPSLLSGHQPPRAATVVAYETVPELTVDVARAVRLVAAFIEMADAVTAGERPQFRTEEQAAAFREDIEARYGAGTLERLRAGDTQDLSLDLPDQDQRAITGMALRLVVASHQVLRERGSEQLKTPAVLLDPDSGPDLDLGF
ncbi:hypothetical protein RM190_22770 [Paracoccus sp. CPCC 101403]|uniref:Phage portal protein n=1 Tax=Paracoccus broussonetiae TaxID=3075834 RepID=A0ABU3EKC1_9RHOB|nr:hypothetical protein [Paracoccus sp. CPCC 101403]MDT1064697.1 hypothetical protein [Paracoccus sp. CPCC 101403]